MRNRSRPSFTVEVKAGGRRQSPTIPSRATAPVASKPPISWLTPAEPQAPVAEPRRILPSLIPRELLQAEPEITAPVQVHPPRRRGRPHKTPPITVDPIAEPVLSATPVPAPKTCAARPALAKRIARPGADLAPGERWKRRLGRWSRLRDLNARLC